MVGPPGAFVSACLGQRIAMYWPSRCQSAVPLLSATALVLRLLDPRFSLLPRVISVTGFGLLRQNDFAVLGLVRWGLRVLREEVGWEL